MVFDRDSGLRLFRILPNLCKKPGQKTPVRSQMAPITVLHWWPLTLTPALVASDWASQIRATGGRAGRHTDSYDRVEEVLRRGL